MLPYLSLGAQPEQQERAREQSQRGQVCPRPEAQSPAPSPRGSHPSQDPHPHCTGPPSPTPCTHTDLPHPACMGPTAPRTPHANRCTSAQRSACTGLPLCPPRCTDPPQVLCSAHPLHSDTPLYYPADLTWSLSAPSTCPEDPTQPTRAIPTMSPHAPTCHCHAPHPRRGCWPRAVHAAGSGPAGPPASASGSAGLAAWPGPGRATPG